MRGKRSFVLIVAAGSLLGSTGLANAAASAQPGVTVVARNLAGPFGIALGPGGQLLVAESDAGKVTKIDLANGHRSTFLSGYPTVDAVDVGDNGTVYALTGEGNRNTPRAQRLFKAPYRGHATVAADLLAYELKHNPDGQSQKARDSLSNPFAVTRLPGRTLVADGGANDVISVSDSGRLSTFFAPHNITSGVCHGARNNDPRHPGCDPVPTGVAQGPDGAIYVSGLGAEAPNAGRVWKLDPSSGRVLRTWYGFTAPTGIAVGGDGSVYLSEGIYGAPEGPPPAGFNPASVGRIVRIAPNGARTYARVTMPIGLRYYHGSLYSTAWSLAAFVGLPPTSGQVVRVRQAAFK